MGELGFSYIGLAYVLLLIIPNIIGASHLPEGFESGEENKWLVLAERIGQAGSLICLVIFKNFNLSSFSFWNIWFFVSLGFLLLYEICWVRYLRSKHSLYDFYRSLFGVPMPMVIFPVISLILLGIYGCVVWLILVAVIFGIGHIGVHLKHRKR